MYKPIVKTNPSLLVLDEVAILKCPGSYRTKIPYRFETHKAAAIAFRDWRVRSRQALDKQIKLCSRLSTISHAHTSHKYDTVNNSAPITAVQYK